MITISAISLSTPQGLLLLPRFPRKLHLERLLDSPATRGRLCLLLLWISSVFCLDSWILSGIINSAMEICLTLTAGVLFWLFFPSLRLASNHPHSLL